MSIIQETLPRNHCADRDKHWAVLLAGGEGSRLLQMTRFVSGDDRPKQFCPLLDSDTLLEKTRKRAERSVRPEQVLFALTGAHRDFYLREPGIRPSQRIVQPLNRGTAPPIVYSLLSIERLDHDAVVAVLPCDHYYSDEPAFTAALESAFQAARLHDSVVILGSPARDAQTEYGWIELESAADEATGLSRVRRFFEKPSPEIARQLFERGALWNTFVMVGHVRAFLELIGAARTGLSRAFSSGNLWAGAETNIPAWLYQRIYATDFSRDILSTQAHRLITQRLGDIGWNDLGQPERVIDVLQAAGLTPRWMKKWQMPTRLPATSSAPLVQAAVA